MKTLMTWRLPNLSAMDVISPKVKISPGVNVLETIVSRRSSKHSPTWRASCRCLLTGSPSGDCSPDGLQAGWSADRHDGSHGNEGTRDVDRFGPRTHVTPYVLYAVVCIMSRRDYKGVYAYRNSLRVGNRFERGPCPPLYSRETWITSQFG